jgi:hypothetical protein
MKDTIFKSAQLMHVQVSVSRLACWAAITGCVTEMYVSSAVLARVCCERLFTWCRRLYNAYTDNLVKRLTDCSVVFTDSNTRTTSSFLQDRNVHGKIFGGYIMNKAFEIAYVAAVRILLVLCVQLFSMLYCVVHCQACEEMMRWSRGCAT